MSNTQEVSTESQRLIGQVKWFNNKTGFGFITVNEGELSGKDIFTHFSTIRVTNSQYKYLVQGEYVEFSVQKMDSGNHEYQAMNIKGILQNDLMCETRHKNRDLSKNSESVVIKSYNTPSHGKPHHKHSKP